MKMNVNNIPEIEKTLSVRLPKVYVDYMTENSTHNRYLYEIDEIVEVVSREDETIPTPDLIIRETARYFSLSPDDIKGHSKTQLISLARQISMYLIRHLAEAPSFSRLDEEE